MSYTDYLQSDHWKNKRKEVFNKSVQGKKCRICSSTENLHIHHKRYSYHKENILGNEKIMHLAVLCNKCHSTWHGVHGKKETSTQHLLYAKFLYDHGATRNKAITFCVNKKVMKEIYTLYNKASDNRIREYIGVPEFFKRKTSPAAVS